MGDRLEEDDWVNDKDSDGEEQSITPDWVEGDSNEEDNDEDEVESIEEWKEEANKEVKKLKRQSKFAALKEKKRQKRAEEEETEHNEEDGGRKSDQAQLTPQEMIRDLIQHAPVPYRTYQQQEQQPYYTEADFFYPALSPSSVTESATKIPCPFVRSLSASFPNYKKVLLSPGNSAENRGSPIMVIITASALRATEVIKAVSSKLIKVKIGKLFAKHFKLSEQIEMLSKTYFPIVIGTPNRIEKLIELGALSLKESKVLLVDHTPDVKNFTTLTLPDVKNDFYKLFYEYVHKEKGHMKIAFIKDVSNALANSNFGRATKKIRRSNGKFDNSQRKGFNPNIEKNRVVKK